MHQRRRIGRPAKKPQDESQTHDPRIAPGVAPHRFVSPNAISQIIQFFTQGCTLRH
jgi:hypothetical protein